MIDKGQSPAIFMQKEIFRAACGPSAQDPENLFCAASTIRLALPIPDFDLGANPARVTIVACGPKPINAGPMGRHILGFEQFAPPVPRSILRCRFPSFAYSLAGDGGCRLRRFSSARRAETADTLAASCATPPPRGGQ